jgi:hypothetical protein
VLPFVAGGVAMWVIDEGFGLRDQPRDQPCAANDKATVGTGQRPLSGHTSATAPCPGAYWVRSPVRAARGSHLSKNRQKYNSVLMLVRLLDGEKISDAPAVASVRSAKLWMVCPETVIT